jgi:Gpi18-like mannosyltransferase
MLAVVAAAFLVRFFLTMLPSFKIDMGGYVAWSNYLANNGPKGMYETFHIVYAPGYLYLLWITGAITKAFSLSLFWQHFFVKIWAVIFEFIGAYLIYKIGTKYGKQRTGFVLGIAYALNPGVFFNSSIWGQFDSMPATMLLGVVYLFNINKKIPAVILFALAALVKPQSGLLAPLVFVQFYKELFDFANITWRNIKKALVDTLYAAIGCITAYTVIIFPFYYHTQFYFKYVQNGASFIRKLLVETADFYYWLVYIYRTSLGDYPYATANAFNFWTLAGGQPVPDSETFFILSYAKWGFIFAIPAILLAFVLLAVKRNSAKTLYFSSFFILASFFTFFTRMHERYLLSAIIFLTVCILWDKRLSIPLIILSACVTANHWYIYDKERRDVNLWLSNYDPVAMPFAFLTVALVIFAAVYMIWLLREKPVNKPSDKIRRNNT